MKYASLLCLQFCFVAGAMADTIADPGLLALTQSNSYSANGLTPSVLPNKNIQLSGPAGVGDTVLFRFTGAQNWNSWDAARFRIQNTGSSPVSLNLTVYTDAAYTPSLAINFWENLQAGEKRLFAMPVSLVGSVYGMQYAPNFEGTTWLQSNYRQVAKWTTITGIQVTVGSPASAASLTIIQSQLVKYSETLTDLVDQFGQSTLSTWSGKPTSLSDLMDLDTKDQTDIQKHAPSGALDIYGGRVGTVRYSTSGRFRTAVINGKWSFVDPLGFPFFSFGANQVGRFDPTITTNRESFFQWLPSPTDPLYQFLLPIAPGSVSSGPTTSGYEYEFYMANLYRKYGTGWYGTWAARQSARMKSYGLNTYGRLTGSGLETAHTVPYTAAVSVDGSFSTVPTTSVGWAPFPDPYDSRFGSAVTGSLLQESYAIGDPWCLGWFVDNEPSLLGAGEENGRYGLVYGVMALDASASPAKTVFLASLENEYGTISALNAAWGTTFGAWSDLNAPISSFPPSSLRLADFSSFLSSMLSKYFSTIRTALKAVDPNALYLGCRFGDHQFPPEAVAAAAASCDVVSFNVYQPTFDPNYFSFMNGLNVPIMVSEFSMGSDDRGAYWRSPVYFPSQADRANAFGKFVSACAADAYVVGAHYFMWVDDPCIGRLTDGENWGNGIVSIADVPYSNMVSSSRAVAGVNGYTTRQLSKSSIGQ